MSNKEVYGIIYKIHNIKNNKIYFGQTTKKRGFKGRYGCKGEGIERVYGHLLSLKNNGSTYNKHLLSAIEKYGFDSFEVDEVFDVAYSREELNKLEYWYIKIYNTNYSKFGYNFKEGGTEFGSDDARRIFSAKGSIPVYCITTKECFISIKDACRKYNISTNQDRIMKGRVYESNGVKLKFRLFKCKTGNETPILCLNDMKIYKSLRSVSKNYTDKNLTTSIRKVCVGERDSCNINGEKYFFCYAGDYFDCMDNITTKENIEKIVNNYKQYIIENSELGIENYILNAM